MCHTALASRPTLRPAIEIAIPMEVLVAALRWFLKNAKTTTPHLWHQDRDPPPQSTESTALTGPRCRGREPHCKRCRSQQTPALIHQTVSKDIIAVHGGPAITIITPVDKNDTVPTTQVPTSVSLIFPNCRAESVVFCRITSLGA